MSVEVRGVPELVKTLDELVEKKKLQKATAAGAKVLKPAVQNEAPRRTGRLRKSVSARAARRDKPASIVTLRPKIAFYRHMVVGGTKAHRIRFPDQKAAGVPKTQGNIRHPGAKANPFVARAAKANEAKALDAVVKVLF